MIRLIPESFYTNALRLVMILAVLTTLSASALGQSTATLRGTVTLGESGKPVHNTLITILQLKRTVGTDESGKYEFPAVPPGRYDVLAHLDRVPDIVQSVDLTAGGE